MVKKDQPVRLNFLREETASCSEIVVLSEFDKSARVPMGEVVSVEFLPRDVGEFEFTCQMGMLRGKLVVEE